MIAPQARLSRLMIMDAVMAKGHMMPSAPSSSDMLRHASTSAPRRGKSFNPTIGPSGRLRLALLLSTATLASECVDLPDLVPCLSSSSDSSEEEEEFEYESQGMYWGHLDADA